MSERKKILVAGGEEGFSQELVIYAIEMAERMDCEIVALNIIRMGIRLHKFLDAGAKDRLRVEVEEKAGVFKKAVAEKNISFIHIVKFGDGDKSIKEAHKEVERISFVITEPEYISGESSAKVSFPVFALVDED